MIRLTVHARQRVQKDGLDRAAWIEAAVTAPDRTVPDPTEPGVTRSFRALPERGGRVLRIAHRRRVPMCLS